MGMLDAKIAFITGGGSGIGRGIAERLAREGANVGIGDIDLGGMEETAELVRQAGRQPYPVKMNVASQPQVQEAVERCVAAFGRLDFVVANAGIGRTGMLLDMPLKDWQDQVDINLTGVFLTAQAAARKMVELGNGGRIICMASLAAETTGAMSWAYSATKAGVRIMVRGWAQELGRHGITVNAIGPGIIDTPLARVLAGDEGSAIRKSVEQLTPVGRVGQPADIAGLVAFLCGPDAAFMTGSYLIMDGGLRDARPRLVPDTSDPRAQEFQRLMREAQQRRERLQPWIDER
jgi:NAD(P)-dependent dehydrogenase (short-subunit alcohol dehydrogenase family)